MMFTVVSMVGLWLVIDWMIMGSRWAHRTVFSRISPALLTASSLSSREQRAIMIRFSATTGISAVSFALLGEWLGFPNVRIVESFVITAVLYVGLVAPPILFHYFYFAVGRRFILLHLGTWALKLLIGAAMFWAR